MLEANILCRIFYTERVAWSKKWVIRCNFGHLVNVSTTNGEQQLYKSSEYAVCISCHELQETGKIGCLLGLVLRFYEPFSQYSAVASGPAFNSVNQYVHGARDFYTDLELRLTAAPRGALKLSLRQCSIRYKRKVLRKLKKAKYLCISLLVHP